jgi:hypothetical protein
MPVKIRARTAELVSVYLAPFSDNPLFNTYARVYTHRPLSSRDLKYAWALAHDKLESLGFRMPHEVQRVTLDFRPAAVARSRRRLYFHRAVDRSPYDVDYVYVGRTRAVAERGVVSIWAGTGVRMCVRGAQRAGIVVPLGATVAAAVSIHRYKEAVCA